MAYDNNKTVEYKDGLEMISNASSLLYMRKNNFVTKSKNCPLKGVDSSYLDYKNVKLLEQFTSERGKILPRRITSISPKKQRLISKSIKRARVLAFLPFEKI